MSKRIMALLSIVEAEKGKKLIKELGRLNIRMNFQSFGFGTAPTETLDLFGLGTKDKDIIISLGAENDIRDMMANFGQAFESHSKYGGLMIVLDVSAASRVLNEILNYKSVRNKGKEQTPMTHEYHNNLIVISVNEGYSEDVMHVARKMGATGGTVLKGRLADMEQFSEFVEARIDGDREMLCILAPKNISKQIMEEVNATFGISSEANGIIFSLPVDKAFKI